MNEPGCILTINAGSSSIKFAIYRIQKLLEPLLTGEFKQVNSDSPVFTYTDMVTGVEKSVSIEVSGQTAIIAYFISWLKKQLFFDSLEAIGHRIVHGLEHSRPALVTPGLLAELHIIALLDPEHMPAGIKLIEAFFQFNEAITQIVCFDTSFHFTMPAIAKLLTIPRKYQLRGLRRYGFHGLSYAYLLGQLEVIAGKKIAMGKVIIAHLGSGASMVAIREGLPLDTSMGFTPTSGLVMSSRTGDLDPGVVSYLMANDHIDAATFSQLVNHESGLLGVSEISGNMQVLQNKKTTNERAAEAVDLFCYQSKKYLGSLAAILEGVDTLIFSGGIGENDTAVRASICSGLNFLGIELDPKANDKNNLVISTKHAAVTVYVIKTNEEIMIAKSVVEILTNS